MPGAQAASDAFFGVQVRFPVLHGNRFDAGRADHDARIAKDTLTIEAGFNVKHGLGDR